MNSVKFPMLGMYTDCKTPVSVMDDFGNLIPQTVVAWHWIYATHFAEAA